MDDYDYQERIAIRMDSGMREEEAIRLTELEVKDAVLQRQDILPANGMLEIQ